MKLASVLTVFSCFVAITTSMTVTPPSGNCWNATLDIIGSEAMYALTSSPLIDEERVYILCSQTFPVGFLPPDQTVPVGGGYPLVIFNPNVHVMCEEPGSCVFEGGLYQLTSLVTNTLLNLFLAMSNLGPLPDGYFVDSSNLIVEGLVFRGASDSGTVKGNVFSNVQLGGPGVNITIKDCLWTEQDTEYPPYGGLTLFRPSRENVTSGSDNIYLDLALVNCTFRNNVFAYSAVRVGDASNNTVPLAMTVTIENTVFEDNTIRSINCNCNDTTKLPEYAAVVSVIRVEGSMANCTLKNNTMERARAAIVTVYSDFEVATDSVTFTDNSIDDSIGKGCTDIANVSNVNGNMIDTCIGDDSATPDKSSASSKSFVGVMVLGFAMTIVGTLSCQ